MIWVLEAKALGDYTLYVRFSDGNVGTVNLKNFVFADARPVVMALRDPNVFAALRVASDTVVWSNGFDLAPEFLHSRLVRGAAA